MQVGKRFNPYRMFVGVAVPNWLMWRQEISQGAKLAYGRLAQFEGNQGEARPREDTLARELGVSERQARRYVSELREAGLVEVVDRTAECRPNLYFFLWHDWIDQALEAEPEQLRTPRTDMSSPPGHIRPGAPDINVLPEETQGRDSGKRLGRDAEQSSAANPAPGLLQSSAAEPRPEWTKPEVPPAPPSSDHMVAPRDKKRNADMVRRENRIAVKEPWPQRMPAGGLTYVADPPGGETASEAVSGKPGPAPMPEPAPADVLAESPMRQALGATVDDSPSFDLAGRATRAEDLIEKAKAKARETRQAQQERDAQRGQKVANLDGKPIPLGKRKMFAAMEHTWRAGIEALLPGVVQAPWQAKERGQLQQLVDMYQDWILVDNALDYVVSNWRAIQLRMLRGKGSVPSVGFLLKFHQVLVTESQRWGELRKVKNEWDAWFQANPNDAYPPQDLDARFKKAKSELEALGAA